jgi:murein DD-endopeptidase MepM/ murein hydrolase activator NlpD
MEKLKLCGKKRRCVNLAQAVVGGGSGYFYYTVKSGDTLAKIGSAYGINYREIMTANNLKTSVIRTGQRLKIPTTHASQKPPTNTGGQSSPVAGNAANFSPMLDKMIGGVLLYGIFRVLMKVF